MMTSLLLWWRRFHLERVHCYCDKSEFDTRDRCPQGRNRGHGCCCCDYPKNDFFALP